MVFARLTSLTWAATADGYAAYYHESNELLYLRIVDDGVTSDLIAPVAQVIVSGDKIGLECIGDEITGYFKDVKYEIKNDDAIKYHIN